MALINLIDEKTLQDIQKEAGVSAVLAFIQLGKVATAKTVKSVRTESQKTNEDVSISVFAGGGAKYIVEGKPANTKMPVKKTANGWELVQELKDWKAVRGFEGSDWQLARTIAKNKREPIDVGTKTLEIFEQNFLNKFKTAILNFTTQEVIKEIKK